MMRRGKLRKYVINTTGMFMSISMYFYIVYVNNVDYVFNSFHLIDVVFACFLFFLLILQVNCMIIYTKMCKLWILMVYDDQYIPLIFK